MILKPKVTWRFGSDDFPFQLGEGSASLWPIVS